ncbi:hypothetical protein FS749_004615 [Ceratobasidium sp. UAMH 11750]|nr:hypothetical protein FS749_004615 [Ceratobasidium sp. UAMH 11750]
MPEFYTCTECPYVTNVHKSYKSHCNQCPALLRVVQAHEKSLQLKQKHKSAGTFALALAHIRPSKRPRLNDPSNTPVLDNVPVPMQDTSNHTALLTDPPLVSGISTLNSLDTLELPAPSEQLPPPQTPPSGLPSYQPTFGHYRDAYEPLPEAPPAIIDAVDLQPAPRIRRVILRVRPEPEPYTTLPDSFGCYRVYLAKPKSIPDSTCELGDLSEISKPPNHHFAPTPATIPDLIAPCPNISVFRLQHWHWNEGNKKSLGARESLINNVISKPDFVPADVSNIHWAKLNNSLASYATNSELVQHPYNLPLSIPPRTPAAAIRYKSDPAQSTFPVPMHASGSLIGTVRSAFEKNNPQFFHYDPYEAYCQDPKTSNVHRSYGEAYESQRMLNAHRAVQQIVLDKPCDLPRCVAALMIFSDATQLSNFGSAKAWPIRVTFGNISKYERCRPIMQNHYEVDFIPSLPADIQDKLQELEPGRPIPKALLTHLR